MRKIISIDYDELQKLDNTIINLRNQLQTIAYEKEKLCKEVAFLKDKGDNILVIVKNTNKPDTFEYKTNEKNIIVDLVSENAKIRERYDELSRQIDNVENQKQLIILKYKEMEEFYKNYIIKLEDSISKIENRSFLDRITNKKINVQQPNIISYVDEKILEIGPPKVIYTEEEIKMLEEKVKEIKKQRGWQFKAVFIDSQGNVYHKGKLQPHLKNKLK